MAVFWFGRGPPPKAPEQISVILSKEARCLGELMDELLDVDLYVCVNVANKKNKYTCTGKRLKVDLKQLLLWLSFYPQTPKASKPIEAKETTMQKALTSKSRTRRYQPLRLQAAA